MIGLVAALVVATLLALVLSRRGASSRSVDGLLEIAGKVAREHGEHPAARGDRAGARR